MQTTSDKMVDDHGPIYLVRCVGTKDGRRCVSMVALSLTEKTVCPSCGAVHGPWSSWLSHRTKDG